MLSSLGAGKLGDSGIVGLKAVFNVVLIPLAAVILLGAPRKGMEKGLLFPNILADKYRVTVFDASAAHTIGHLAASNVLEINFSPLGNFVITWQRPWRDESGAAGRNLKVWTMARSENCPDDSGLMLAQFSQKSQTARNLQFTNDEKYCGFIVTNEIHFYRVEDLQHPCDKLRVEGVTDFAISPGDAHSVAIFIPERKVRKLPRDY